MNNKSSSCINPDYFNPLINYNNEEKKKKKIIRRNYITNKDHFVNMMPTQLYKYIPHTKQSIYNFYLKSQIDNLPGSTPSPLCRNVIKRKGKKTFKNKFEESKDNYDLKNFKNKTYLYKNPGKNIKVYEFDNPIITHRDLNSKI